MWVFDVTNPAAGINIADAAVGLAPTSIHDMKVYGNVAYATDQGALVTIDITNPATPTYLGRLEMLVPSSLLVDPNAGLLYVNRWFNSTAGMDWHLKVLDISDPFAPAELSSYFQEAGFETTAGEMVIRGNLLYTNTPDGVTVADVSNSLDVHVIGRAEASGYGNYFGIDIDGDHAFGIGGAKGLQVVDISVPESPPVYGNVPNSTGSVKVKGNLLVSGSGQVFDISDPMTPVELSTISGHGDAALVDQYAFVSNTSTIKVWDLADPAAPVLLADVAGGSWNAQIEAYHPAGSSTIEVWVPGNQGNGRFYTFDPQDPGAFGFSYFGIGGRSRDLLVDCGRWYFGSDSNRLNVASSPTASSYGTLVLSGWWATSLCASGDFVFCAMGNGHVIVADFSNLLAPVQIAEFAVQETEAYPFMTLSDGILYVTQGDGGLYVVDVTDPYNPLPLGGINPSGPLYGTTGVRSVRDVAVGQGVVYMADLGNGLQVLPIQCYQAQFTDHVAITASAGAGGSISPAGIVDVPFGCGLHNFRITPDAGYTIADVLVDGTTVGPVGEYDFLDVVADRTIEAVFAPESVLTCTVLSPNGGESLTVDDPYELTWQVSGGTVACVDLLLSRDGAAGTFETIATCVPNTGSYFWTTTGPGTVHAILRVDADDGGGNTATDISDAEFTIDDVVANVLQRFDAAADVDGIHLTWTWNDPDGIVASTVERGESSAGPWVVLDVPVRVEGENLIAIDTEAESGRTHWYHLKATTSGGQTVILGLVSAEAASGTIIFGLAAPAPNPTTASSSVQLSLPQTEMVRVSVYNIRGQEVAVLADGVMQAGRHEFAWGGRTQNGPAASGVYFIRARGNSREATRRLVLTR